MKAAAAVLFFASAATATEASTYQLQTVPGARSVAMGDAFRAVGTSNDAIVDNPAALAMAQHYEIDGYFGYAFASPATYWNGSLVDSSTVPLAMGVDYTHLASGTSPDRFGGSDLRLALAYPLTDNFFVGVSGHWIDFQPPSSASWYSVSANAITGDAALVYKPIDLVSIALVGYNLVDIKHPELAPLSAALAVAVGSDTSFHVASDLVANFSGPNPTFDYHGGAEYLIAQLVAVRAGYMYDALQSAHFASIGAALIMSTFAVDVSFRQQIPQWNDNLLVVGLKFFLPS